MTQVQMQGGETRPGELVRALAAVCDTPSAAAGAAGVLGLGPVSIEEHTRVFVLNCPPYASAHLGDEGGLGGDATGRVARFWSALGIVPTAEADHLSSLLALYACMQDEEGPAERRSAADGALQAFRHTLLREHLWSWVPGYTRAVEQLGLESLARWAQLTRRVLAAELAAMPSSAVSVLPMALSEARPPPGSDGGPDGLEGLLDTLVVPVRSGVILTRESLAAAASRIGAGHRLGERRFMLRAMLEQDPTAGLEWLAGEARRWALRHRRAGRDPSSRWWSARADATAGWLSDLLCRS